MTATHQSIETQRHMQSMPDKPAQKAPRAKVSRVRLTARITLAAYDAIAELQRRYRRRTGKALRLWQVLDTAVIDYAKKQGIEVGG